MKPPTFSFADHKRWSNPLLFRSLFKAKVPRETDERRKQRSLEMGNCSFKSRRRQLSNTGGCRERKMRSLTGMELKSSPEKWTGRGDVAERCWRSLERKWWSRVRLQTCCIHHEAGVQERRNVRLNNTGIYLFNKLNRSNTASKVWGLDSAAPC